MALIIIMSCKLLKIFLLSFILNNCNNTNKSHEDYRIEYYADGTKKSEGQVIKSLRTGTWKFYYPNGKIRNVCYYLNGKKNGISIQYFPNGKISDSINYKDGHFNGLVKFYYPNGQLNFEDYYEDNKLNRNAFQFKSWYSSGMLNQAGWKKGNKMTGKWLKYYSNGAIEYISHYDSLGNKDSTWSYYSPTGILIKKEEYKLDSLIKTLSTPTSQ